VYIIIPCHPHKEYFLKIRLLVDKVLVEFFLQEIDYNEGSISKAMTEIIRVCKPGSKWTQDDLKSFNISVLEKSEEEFFGISLEIVSLDGVPDGLVNLEWPSTDDPDSCDILIHLDLAMSTLGSGESAIDDFASRLLEILKFNRIGQVIGTRRDIKMVMCGKNTHAKTDVCIIDKKGIFFLIQEDKSYMKFPDPEPQIIAEAIAAFQHNNIRLKYSKSKDIKDHVFPCITMIGTYPTFYKVKVTKELDEAVRLGKYPKYETLVEKFNPIDDESGYSYGMKPLRYRKRILQSFIAFRGIYNNTLSSL
jgi:hypothetical protein